MEAIVISVEFTDAEAWQFAQFLKRIGHREYRELATSNDEAHTMMYAGNKIQKALAEAGYAPR